MGFFSSIAKGLVGTVAGFLSGGDKTTSSQNSSQRVNLKPWDDSQRSMLNSANEGIAANQMTPEEARAMEERAYANLYNPAKAALDQTVATKSATDYGNRARRGGAQNSAGVDQDRSTTLAAGRADADIAANASLGATNVRLQEEQSRRANVQQYMQQISELWNQRLRSSGITTNSNSEQTSPNTFLSSAANILGGSSANPGSYLNNTIGNWFNNSGGADANGRPNSYGARGMTTDPIGD